MYSGVDEGAIILGTIFLPFSFDTSEKELLLLQLVNSGIAG